MNLSQPFFSWTCLFPDEVAYRCAPHTTWARQDSGDRNGNGGTGTHTVYVTADRSAAELPDPAGHAGLVALNCRGLSDRRLRDAGFPYARRFAVLPNAGNPRWFIPLDTPALAAAGFCLCAPFKRAARIKHFGARTAARLGLPVWYRDHLCIAQRETPPLEQALSRLFDGVPLRLALSSGTPPPAINRKISLALLATDGRALAFAKLPGPCTVSEGSVRREASVLAQLASLPATRAPRLLFAGGVGARYAAVYTPLNGRAPRVEPAEAHRKFLDGLRTDRVRVASDTDFVRALSDRKPLLRSRPALMAALHELLPVLGTLRLPATTVHGDFVPWNLREHRGVIGAFDWEYGEIDGLPLIDETHHLLAVGYLLKKWTPEHAYQRLAGIAAAPPLGLSVVAVRALQLAYLLDYLLRLFGEGHGDEYPRVAWCRQIVSRLVQNAVRGAAA